MPVTYNWQRLSPQEFVLLQEIVSYSQRKLKDVLQEFNPNGSLASYNPEQPTDFDGCQMFITTYLGGDVPDDLLRHLFLCFAIKPLSASPSNLEQANSSNVTSKVENGNSQEHPPTLISSNPSLATNGDDKAAQKSPTANAKVTTAGAAAGSAKAKAGAATNARSGTAAQAITRRKSNPTLQAAASEEEIRQAEAAEAERARIELQEIEKAKVFLKDLICYLSIIEAGKPEEKLEFMFKLYDRDGNGSLDANEIESIINQMMAVAEFLEWDVTELRPVLQDMMKEIDYDADGTVSLEEWKRGGLTTIPLLVLLGIDETVRDDGVHVWALKHFKKVAHCNVCQELISGMRKQGLSCTFCKYAAHQRCAQKAAANCITTYTKTRKTGNVPTLAHHWVSGTCSGKCDKCKRTIKPPNGQRCRWCKGKVCSKCASSMKQECELGRLRKMILPPTCIFPAVFERKSITAHNKQQNQHQSVSEKMPSVGVNEINADTPAIERTKPVAASSFQIECPPDISPLFVFTNPKSGGKQGITLFRKFQYLLNPRQVFDLIKCKGPMQGLLFLKDIKNARILCAGGDGTVGWLLEVMDKIDWPVGRPPVGVLPLGTGNDLARVLNFGSGYEGESLMKILDRLERATTVHMDRWKIEVSEAPKHDDDADSDDCKEQDEREKNDPVPSCILNNYFSIGLDASIAYRFHILRERHPEKFKTRMRNKFFYFEFGLAETFTTICKNLHQYVDVMVDGMPLDLSHGTPLEGITILNIPSIYGGTNLWGSTSKSKQQEAQKQQSPKQNGVQPISWKDSHLNLQELPRNVYTPSGLDISHTSQDLADGMMEVAGIESTVQMSQIRVGVRSSAIRLAQCKTVTIRTKRRFPMQIDGEPWMQAACTIHISHKNKVPMFVGPKTTEKRGWFNFSSKSRDAGACNTKNASDQSS